MLTSVEIRQELIDLKIPMKDELKAQLIHNQRLIRRNYIQSAGGWLVALEGTTP
jgi:hypothetical protein